MVSERSWKIWDKAGIYALLAMVVGVFCMASPDFRSIDNLSNILLQSAPIGIAASGMTLAIISGTFDLSVGSMMALTACVIVSLIDTMGFAGALVVGLVLGFCLGLVNGLIITRLRVPPLIATLATMWIFRSLAFIYTANKPMQATDNSFIDLGGTVGHIPYLFAIMTMCYLGAGFLLYYTRFGRYVFAIGSNRKAAVLCGIDLAKVTVLVFGLVGLMSAAGAAALAVRLGSAKADTAMGYELTVIATVVLGGTSLKGGSGTLAGTFGAAVLFAVIYNAMDKFEVQSYWQKIALGGILLLALGLDALRKKYAFTVAKETTHRPEHGEKPSPPMSAVQN